MNNQRTIALIHADDRSDYNSSYYQAHKDWKKQYNKDYYRKNKQYWVERANGKAPNHGATVAKANAEMITNQSLYNASREAEKLANAARKAAAIVTPTYTTEDAARDTASNVFTLGLAGAGAALRVGVTACADVLKKTGSYVISGSKFSDKLGSIKTAAKACASILKTAGKFFVKDLADAFRSGGANAFGRG